MDSISYYALLVALGITPSLVWLAYYYRKDPHPEPATMIAKTFLMGIIISPIAIILQLLFVRTIEQWAPGVSTHGSVFFLWAAFVEESVKLYAVRSIALYSPDFDEPTDAMEYMIAAALGFAAMENILVMFQIFPDGANAALGIWALRFAGATLLHALSSALLGYFIAMAWFFHGHAKKIMVSGLVMATLFHFTFNTFLSTFKSQTVSLAYTTALLVAMAFLISILFDKMRERSTAQSATLA